MTPRLKNSNKSTLCLSLVLAYSFGDPILKLILGLQPNIGTDRELTIHIVYVSFKLLSTVAIVSVILYYISYPNCKFNVFF